MSTGERGGKKGRPQRPLDPDADPIQRFAHELRGLRPPGLTYRKMADRVHYSAQTLSAAVNGRQLPSLEVTRAFVQACGGDTMQWEQRWHDTRARLLDADIAEHTTTPVQSHPEPAGPPSRSVQPAEPSTTPAAGSPHQPAAPGQAADQPPHPARQRNRGLAFLALAIACIAFVIWQQTNNPQQPAPRPQQTTSPTASTASRHETNARYSATLGPGCGMATTGKGGTHNWYPVDGLPPTTPGCSPPLYTKDSGSAPGAGPWLAWAEWIFHPKPGQRCTLSVYIPDTSRADTKKTDYEVFADTRQHSLLGRYELNQATSHDQWVTITNRSGDTTYSTYTATSDTLDLTITDAAGGHAFLVADLAKASCT